MSKEERLKNRILEISKKYKLSHIGSCLSVLPILKHIYSKKQSSDLVILDNAHAHIAHLVVREEEAVEGYILGMGAKLDVDDLIKKNGIHCDRSVGCDASGGSLGHGIGISIGLSLADRTRKVFCVVSDGSMMEGSNWEALRIKDSLKLENLKIYGNINGFTAVAAWTQQDLDKFMDRYTAFGGDRSTWDMWLTTNGAGFEGVQGHYKTL